MRCFIPVQRHGFFHRTNKIHLAERKRVLAFLQKGRMGLFVVDLGMFPEYLGNIGGQRTINIDRHRFYGPLVVEFVNDIQQFLGPPECKRGNNDRAPPFQCFRQDSLKLGFEIYDRVMKAVAVGAFHEH